MYVCMKYSLTVYIDQELALLIKKKENRSSWANEVFRERLEKEELDLMDESRLKKQLAIEKAKEKLQKEIQDIENGNY